MAEPFKHQRIVLLMAIVTVVWIILEIRANRHSIDAEIKVTTDSAKMIQDQENNRKKFMNEHVKTHQQLDEIKAMLLSLGAKPTSRP